MARCDQVENLVGGYAVVTPLPMIVGGALVVDAGLSRRQSQEIAAQAKNQQAGGSKGKQDIRNDA